MSHSILTLSHLYPSLERPGLGSFVRDEVIELKKRNAVTVVSPVVTQQLRPWHWRDAETTSTTSVESGVDVLRPLFPSVPLGGLLLESRLWARALSSLLDRVYREICGDLIHAHFVLSDGFAAAWVARRTRAPLVVTAWGSDVMVFGAQRRLRSTFRSTFEQASAVIAVSEQVAARAESLGAAADRINVIPGGVPYLTAVPRDEARRLLGVPDDVACVVWAGGLVSVKQPGHVISAFESVAKKTLDGQALLVLVGDGPLRDELTASITKKGLERSIRLAGRLGKEHVWRWQCAADVFVNSSRSEGTPLAVLEALGAGTPVVAYDVGGTGAAIRAVDGGGVTDSNTPEALAGAIVEQLCATVDRAGLAAAARDRFNIARTTREIEAVYRAVT